MSGANTPHVASEMERARRVLRSAWTLLPDDPGSAANRTYYAAFHAAKAALLSVGERPRTHSGTRGRFAFHFVRTGRIAPEIGRALGSAEELRLLADYDEGAELTPADVRPVVEAVERFVTAVEAALAAELGGSLPPDED